MHGPSLANRVGWRYRPGDGPGQCGQVIFADDTDREKLLKDVEDTVLRYGW
jgi:hypothetical protein